MIYLDAAATTLQKPDTVRLAVLRAMQRCASVGRGGHPPAMEAAESVYRCRQIAAELFGAEAEQVVFTMNATHALNIAVRSLVHPGDEVAEKRLEAIREYAEFGSGFKIAMRDLEIRGAGDLLGSEQSGHMMSVGYDMYLKLLEEAVLEEQGEGALKEPECTADLNITANIAKTYVTSGEQRMDLYRRMAAIRSQSDADDLLDEIVDRYGDPPKGVLNLIDVALLRARAAAAGITEISQKDTSVMIFMAVLDFAAVSACCAAPEFKGRIFFAAGKQPQLTVKLAKGEDALKIAQKLVGNYAVARSSSTESGNP